MPRNALRTALAVATLATTAAPAAQAEGRLILRPDAEGWTLVSPGGDVVFRAQGSGGKRQCLKFALARGVIRVT
jgi:hypothetical protein